MEALLVTLCIALTLYLATGKTIHVKITHEHIHQSPQFEEISDDKAELEVSEQETLTTAQRYLDDYLNQGGDY